MIAYKGFNRDMTCRGFRFKEGKEYTEEKAVLCESGFHACERPLDVLGYYPPADSVYHIVELDEVSDERKEDSKVCGKKIKIGAEVDIAGLVKATIGYNYENSDKKKRKSATGDRGAASAGHETAVAVAWGIGAKARGVVGSHLVIADWRHADSVCWLCGAQLVRVDGEKIKENTYYTIQDGRVVEAE